MIVFLLLFSAFPIVNHFIFYLPLSLFVNLMTIEPLATTSPSIQCFDLVRDSYLQYVAKRILHYSQVLTLTNPSNVFRLQL